jgi:hypothetical protein
MWAAIVSPDRVDQSLFGEKLILFKVVVTFLPADVIYRAKRCMPKQIADLQEAVKVS